MLVNVVGNLIMVQFIGIYGVILSTIISMIVSWPWENYTVFKYIFKCSQGEYYRQTILYILLGVACCALTWLGCYFCPDNIGGFVLRVLVCLVVPNVIFFLIFRKNENFISLKSRFRRTLKR